MTRHNRKGKSLLDSIDFQALIFIHKIIVNPEYSESKQFEKIREVMFGWSKRCQGYDHHKPESVFIVSHCAHERGTYNPIRVYRTREQAETFIKDMGVRQSASLGYEPLTITEMLFE